MGITFIQNSISFFKCRHFIIVHKNINVLWIYTILKRRKGQIFWENSWNGNTSLQVCHQLLGRCAYVYALPNVYSHVDIRICRQVPIYDLSLKRRGLAGFLGDGTWCMWGAWSVSPFSGTQGQEKTWCNSNEFLRSLRIVFNWKTFSFWFRFWFCLGQETRRSHLLSISLFRPNAHPLSPSHYGEFYDIFGIN